SRRANCHVSGKHVYWAEVPNTKKKPFLEKTQRDGTMPWFAARCALPASVRRQMRTGTVGWKMDAAGL
ncbi:MAG: hypothetical protein AAF933_16710, partial [Pseudomonadota bacterium]